MNWDKASLKRFRKQTLTNSNVYLELVLRDSLTGSFRGSNTIYIFLLIFDMFYAVFRYVCYPFFGCCLAIIGACFIVDVFFLLCLGT